MTGWIRWHLWGSLNQNWKISRFPICLPHNKAHKIRTNTVGCFTYHSKSLFHNKWAILGQYMRHKAPAFKVLGVSSLKSNVAGLAYGPLRENRSLLKNDERDTLQSRDLHGRVSEGHENADPHREHRSLHKINTGVSPGVQVI